MVDLSLGLAAIEFAESRGEGLHLREGQREDENDGKIDGDGHGDGENMGGIEGVPLVGGLYLRSRLAELCLARGQR